jgi:predicted dehydrogenase
MKSLIIGMSIGQLYKQVLTDLEHHIVTVDLDPDKHANYIDVETALAEHICFDTVHICTPNFTHETIARQVAEHSRIVFIEKPGVESALAWFNLVQDYPKTRFMMVKNNQYRENIAVLTQLAHKAKIINLTWNNNDRVPNPGTWFTTKELAYGGVSRDLLPHLLSLFQSLSGFSYDQAKLTNQVAERFWSLPELTQTDYGRVDANGTYDVDDQIELDYTDTHGCHWIIESNWRTLTSDDRSILMTFEDGSHYYYELGLCPEDAYKRMISTAIEMKDTQAFWDLQLELDIWIHKTIENIDIYELA